jgi:hypothetical protein
VQKQIPTNAAGILADGKAQVNVLFWASDLWGLGKPLERATKQTAKRTRQFTEVIFAQTLDSS